MKPIRNLVETLEPHFKEGGKYEKYHPAFDALATFLFVPGHTTENGVHIRDAMDLKRTMFTVVIAMIPTLLFGMWNVGYQHYLAYGMDTSLMENFMFGFWRVMPIVVVFLRRGPRDRICLRNIQRTRRQRRVLGYGVAYPTDYARHYSAVDGGVCLDFLRHYRQGNIRRYGHELHEPRFAGPRLPLLCFSRLHDGRYLDGSFSRTRSCFGRCLVRCHQSGGPSTTIIPSFLPLPICSGALNKALLARPAFLPS